MSGTLRAPSLFMIERVAAVVAVLLVGCTADGSVEDPADDSFLGGDAKADAFGVEDWSPDGAAVLRLVTAASEDKLDNEVGLSARVARSIVKARDALPGKKFTDLAQLDAASYVGKTVFNQLLAYVAEHHMFRTSLRVPLLLEDENDQSTKPIASFNTQAHAVGLSGFARYTFVDSKTDFDAKMTSYNQRLEELATKANITLGGEMLMYAYSYSDFTSGSDSICYIGDGDQVADVMGAQAGVMVGEMYSMWGWRHGATKWVDDNIEEESELTDDFADYDTHSSDVLVIYTNNDDGDNATSDVIPKCR